jgi:hypothetical protein
MSGKLDVGVQMTQPYGSDRATTRRWSRRWRGRRGAFEVLYRRHLPWLLVRLGRRCASREVVDEVAQDTFRSGLEDGAAVGRAR